MAKTLAQVLEKRWEITEKIKELKARHAEELKPFEEAVEKLEALVNQDRLKNEWTTQRKFDNGRGVKVNTTRHLSVRAANWGEFIEWAQQQDEWENLLTKKVAKNNMIALEKEGIEFPDCVEESFVEKLSFS
jgi:hypothetical protein